jgi:hypothetical protein
MRTLSPAGQRWLKCFHVFFTSVWTGAALSLLTINLFLHATDGMELYGINVSMKFIDDFVIIPAAVGCFLTGLLYSLYTHWGWFKHRWITVKWIITSFGILSGTFLLGPLLNSLAPLSKAAGLEVLRNQQYLYTKYILYGFGSFQAATLIFAVFISILKPWKKRTLATVDADAGNSRSAQSASLVSSEWTTS